MSNRAQLLEAIKAEALSGIWAKGVILAREGAVALQSQTDREVELRVRAPGRTVAQTVVLYPSDEAWECDCDSRVDPCEHVVGAAVSWQQAARQDGLVVAAERKWGRVLYRFKRIDGGLSLQRALAHPGGSEEPLEGSLAAYLSVPSRAAKLQVEQHDLQADRLLDRPTRGPLHPDKLDALLQILAPARTAFLDGKPVAISDRPVLPRAVVEDRGEKLAITLTRSPQVTEVVGAGVALCGDILARIGEQALAGARLQHLPSTKEYSGAQLGEVAARVLPELARHLPVEMRTRRLPPIDRALKPRVELELNQVEGGLSVLPTLVYGSPAQVRIDAGKMVFLRGAVPLRDEVAEQRLVQRLRDSLGLLPGRRMTFSGRDVVPFADKLRRFEGSLRGDGAKLLSRDVRLTPTVRWDELAAGAGAPGIRLGVEFRIEGTDGGNRIVEAAAVLSAWREGLGLVPLDGGGWAPLPQAWLDRHGAKVAELLASRRSDGSLLPHALPQLASLCEGLNQPEPPGLERLAPLLEGFEKLPPPALPQDLAATLRPYQHQGVAWLQFLRSAELGGILADDMGLGKTLQTICALEKGSLVVCPTSVLPNWAAELRRFRPSLRVCIYHGPERALEPDADVTLTTYALLRLDAAQLSAKFWETAVLDEAQAIKNPESQVARAAFGLKARFRIALSGTPLENRLEELWSLMHFANPGLLGGRGDFDDAVARPMAEGRAGVAAELRRKLRPFVLRRLKKDVATDLPPRSESVLHVTLDERERAVYDTVMAATRKEVVALLQEGGGVMKALEALLRLRQAACHSALLPGQHAESSSKLEALLEALSNAASDGHKALVFSQWTRLLDLIGPALERVGLGYERLDGSTQNRGEVTERFQSPDGPPVMLISLKAGGTGLNLTAADHVFLMDPWWNPAVEAQAADRAHRIGQERPVMVYRLVAQDTVEGRILGLQEKKRALFEAALSEASQATAITREDLLELFA